ncbi:MAG TPA: sulfatase [Thermomicrobiales bacterium]|nr:sulfatase [Thermomicrobiales bacterium]
MTAGRLPNFLFLTCHDLGRYLGCYGISTVRTPNLDRLAANGVRFEQAFCTAPQCSCSRAAMYTGRYPHTTGVLGLTHGAFAWDMNPDEQLIGQVLHEAGYATFLLGIHHETRQGPPEQVAERCGMDEVLPPASAKVLVDQAIERLDRFSEGQQPFYIQVGFHEPHRIKSSDEPDTVMGFVGDEIEPDDELGVHVPPYLLDDDGTRTEMAELQGAIRNLDRQVGRLLQYLDRSGLAGNTLTIATTDHGIAMPRAKCTLYDPGIETALIMRLPARGWSDGRTIPEMVSNVDLFPTLVELAGLPVDERIHGRSLLPLLDRGSYTPREQVFSELTYHDYYDPRRAIRTATHKLIVNFSAAPSFMDPTQSWQPRSRPAIPTNPATAYHPPIELYDLRTDPNEQTNLADIRAHATTRVDLLARLHTWMQETSDPLLDGPVSSPSHDRAIEMLRDA